MRYASYPVNNIPCKTKNGVMAVITYICQSDSGPIRFGIEMDDGEACTVVTADELVIEGGSE